MKKILHSCYNYYLLLLVQAICGCSQNAENNQKNSELIPPVHVSANNSFMVDNNNVSFFWLGDASCEPFTDSTDTKQKTLFNLATPCKQT